MLSWRSWGSSSSMRTTIPGPCRSPSAFAASQERGDLLIDGNGTDDDDLAAAGLTHAQGLVASADSDVDNLYITLSARAQRPELLIVARASNEHTAQKLRLAGADRVIQ